MRSASGRRVSVAKSEKTKNPRRGTVKKTSPDQPAQFETGTAAAPVMIDAEKLAQADRASAREMQAKTGSSTPAILASFVTVGFFAILVGLMTGDLKTWDNAGLQMLIGSLGTSWGMVVSFYFGASHIQPGDKK